ncbi:MAG: 2-aminoethylphosphonate--pyruvate transaminase [Verrucomicrobiota bacterium]
MPKPERKCLFTPGPLNTSDAVRQAMLLDKGSREPAFIQSVKNVRQNILKITDLDPDGLYTVVPMQGSGTFSIEAAIGTFTAKNAKLLILVNGAYGRRMVSIAEHLGIDVQSLEFEETEAICPLKVAAHLKLHPDISLVATVHCETTTGIMNPLEKLGEVTAAASALFMVDAMSSFGGIKIDFSKCRIDCLVSSANKCLESVPGLGFVIAKKTLLQSAQGQARSLSFDLHAQWQGLENNGQFRFTPPTHVILALEKALEVLTHEGGIEARSERYHNNRRILMSGMTRLGFRPVIEDRLQSPVIATFHHPKDSRFKFTPFYQWLAERDLIIYPGKVSRIDSFRIGTIGDLQSQDFHHLLESIEEYLKLTGIDLPLKN